MTEWMKCTKTGECKLTDCPHFKNPHRKVDEINHCRADGCNFSCHGTVCVPYRLRVGDRVRTPLGDVGEINELTYNNKSAKVYDKSGRLVTHCLLTDLEYLPPESDTKTLNLANLPERLLCETVSESKPEPTYRWTGKLLTVSAIAAAANMVEFRNFYENWLILLYFGEHFYPDQKIKVNDDLIKYASKSKCFMDFLKDGYIEEVKPEWLLG
uniref:Uncharacterized protein n=1 Tax=viral metagenome TaxID=1070528 RepID=A0A6M3XSB5_9ZZZZ